MKSNKQFYRICLFLQILQFELSNSDNNGLKVRVVIMQEVYNNINNKNKDKQNGDNRSSREKFEQNPSRQRA